MAQTYTIDCFDPTNVGQSDLANMENNFEALRTTFSGAGAPANAIAGKQWFDTTKKLFKIRNDANDAWLGVLAGTASLKMLVYRNTAEDGWAIDGGVTDRVVAIKGGATYTTGAAVAGSWTLPDYTLLTADVPAHTHSAASAAHYHGLQMNTDGGQANVTATSFSFTEDMGGTNPARVSSAGNFPNTTLVMSANATHTHTSVGGAGAHNHGATYRPAAAVFTIQYPDI